MTTRPLLRSPLTLARTVDAGAAADELLRTLPLGGTAFALLLSLAVHGGVVLALAFGAHRASAHASLARAALVEVTPLDLSLAPEPMGSAQVAPGLPRADPASPARGSLPRDQSARQQERARAPGDAELAAGPAAIASPTAHVPRFALTVASAMRTSGGAAAADSVAQTPGSSALAEPVPEASVDIAAKLLVGAAASYPREAEAAGVEADVPLEIVVDGAGAVASARALAHVGYGLDEAAVHGVRAYRFSPARRAGRALAVRMRWVMRFQLR